MILMETKRGNFKEMPGGAAVFPSAAESLNNSEFTLNTSWY